jgi:hypothetical protein
VSAASDRAASVKRQAEPAGSESQVELAKTKRLAELAKTIRSKNAGVDRPRFYPDEFGLRELSMIGVVGALVGSDLTRVMESVNDIRFGEIYVNRIGPESLQGFHVGYRSSGIGGDDGPHGLDLYLRKKTVYVNYSGKPPTALMPY